MRRPQGNKQKSPVFVQSMRPLQASASIAASGSVLLLGECVMLHLGECLLLHLGEREVLSLGESVLLYLEIVGCICSLSRDVVEVNGMRVKL